MPEYLRLVFLRDCLAGKFARLAPGVGIVHLTAERMVGWQIPVPPTAEQQRIVGEVDRLETVVCAIVSELESTRKRAASLRLSVLKWVFEGRLVDQKPSDEPASVLLERIREERAITEENRPRRKKVLDTISKAPRKTPRLVRTMPGRRA